MTLSGLLSGDLPRGVYRSEEYDETAAETAALAAGWGFAPVRGAATKRDTLEAIGAALGFGAHYGRNLDALADCLRDLRGPTLLLWRDWAGLAENDPTAFGAIVHVLGQAGPLAVLLAGPGPALDVPALLG
ncbi:barstar family protein [Nocardioides sp.]|jgi:RNAse (barnase) inhibitor barstar|uniref:barstar family protein n=1 Tax=Nocardioides sp. TaxID=35761 RepID=UPI002C884254|nr:barstar family protein [Nocardioides sp.]HVX53979.1 barstar family protein [Nocardioides sp.]